MEIPAETSQALHELSSRFHDGELNLTIQPAQPPRSLEPLVTLALPTAGFTYRGSNVEEVVRRAYEAWKKPKPSCSSSDQPSPL